MSQILFADNAQTTLASGITSTQTSISLASGTGSLFPSPSGGSYFALTFNDVATGNYYEVCYCTARAGDTLTVTRAQEGTSGRAWLAGDLAYNAVTSGALAGFAQTAANNTFTGTNTGGTYSGITLSGTTTLPGSGQISSGGNLGIGLTPSTSWNSGWNALEIGAAGGATLSSPSAGQAYWAANAIYTSSGWQYRSPSSTNATLIAMGGGAISFQTAAAGTTGNAISFTQAMTLDNNGNLLVGVSSATYSCSEIYSANSYNTLALVNNHATAPYGCLSYFTGGAPNNGVSYFFKGADTGATRFVAYSNGGISNYSANNVNLSDERTKKNIALAGSYLAKINAIPVKTFLYSDQTDTALNLGVMAQDVQAVAPELVNPDSGMGTAPDGTPYLGVYETDMHYAVMRAVQELSAQVTAQAATIAAMQAQLAALTPTTKTTGG